MPKVDRVPARVVPCNACGDRNWTNGDVQIK